jgi:Zn-dependent M28 family amino/carboxypeptidase
MESPYRPMIVAQGGTLAPARTLAHVDAYTSRTIPIGRLALQKHRFLLALSLAAATACAPATRSVDVVAQVRVPPSSPARFSAAAAAVRGTPADDPRIHEIVSAASPVRVERDIRRLADFGTRHTLSDTLSATRGIGAARRWIFAEFARISAACGGCLEVMYVSDVLAAGSHVRIPRETKIVNVVAVQRGTTDPERRVIVQGHYDSRATDVGDATIDAPGANDNASGTAAVLEAARLLTRHQFDATIVYAALAGEEQGLHGGAIFAAHASDEGWRIEAVLNNDIIGNSRGITGLVDNTTARVFAPGIRPDATEAELRRLLAFGGELDGPSRQLGRYLVRTADLYLPTLDVQLIYRLDRFGRGSDHTPFFLRGFPAVRISETHEDYTRQHQDLRVEDGIEYGDVADAVDFPYATRITALNAAALASLAWAPASPQNVTIAGAVQPHTTLRWDAVPSENLEGYRVHWREPAAAAWTHSRWVGNVTEFTLENVVVDNHFFGVAAVSRTGQESLVVFPSPAR